MLDQILALTRAAPDRTVVILCWERLDAKHPHCHRTILVDLLVERARASATASTPGTGTP